MRQAASAYNKVAKQIVSPRELEAKLLLDAASRLQAIGESWDNRKSELDDALHFNRRLWALFVTAVTRHDSPLPAEIRQNIANLGLYVIKQTVAALADPRPQQLGSLISINRELAAGLLGRA
jgi:flagellar protein FlaF